MSDTTSAQTVGLFGLGLIGASLAKRLIVAGFSVRGFDPDPDCMARLDASGGQSMDEADVWAADIILSAVFNTEQLEALVINAPKSQSKPLISMSTCDPALIPKVADIAAKKGIVLIEAPISGTSADLVNGDAILLVAGDQSVASELAPIFEILSRGHFFVGAMGNGNKAKLAINLILGLSRAALAEGIVFAKAVGLDPETFFEIARESAAASKVMESKGPKMVARDFAPLGRIKQSAKDFRLISATGIEAGQGLPMVERYLDIVDDSLARGEGDLDNSAVMLAIERTQIPD